jgi:hypothetical protein
VDVPFAIWRGPLSHKVRFLLWLTVFAAVCGQALFLKNTKRDDAHDEYRPSFIENL